ncbi:MAG TPA: ribosome-associated translation inhibitor RaiA, partial [Firmicutes bacterium]|nr:ribosome-associated translation inhibitor RaiA [Bacillota bacterium]
VKVGGLLLRGEEKSDDIYAAIDGAVDKIERQVRKFKTRINKRRTTGVVVAENVIPEPQVEEGRIVKTKRFAIKPMSVEEAAMQMDLLG